MANEAQTVFGLHVAAFRRALRRDPDGVTVHLSVEEAAALRSGLAVERAWLRDLGDGMGELVVQPPGEEPPRLLGWSPLDRRGRR